MALYDGRCRFCTASAERLRATARGALDLADFHEDGALERFPGVTHEDCMRALQLVDRDGRVYEAAEAVARALRLGRPLLGRLALAYYVPGIRHLSEWAYARVARSRYRLFGRTEAAAGRPACDEGGTCRLHVE